MRTSFLRLAGISAFVFFTLSSWAQKPLGLLEFIKSQPEIRVTQWGEANQPQDFVLFLRQPVNHQNPGKGYFEQRIYLHHVHDSLPVVMVTEGYSAEGSYLTEPAEILHCNQLIVEHRYFGESVPDSMDWSQLTTANAAADHHHIYEVFSRFYKQKWISTGISKGGQTSIFYKYYYPNDMHISIPYVAPLNLEQEDVRINWFLRHVGTPEDNARILNYQRLMLRNFDKIFPLFQDIAKTNQKKFAINDTAAYEFMVLELPFSFYQWGFLEATALPQQMLSPVEMMKPMFDLGLATFYYEDVVNSFMPFMVQAYRELGYYNYDTDSLGTDLRKLKNTSNIAFVPNELRFPYDAQIMKKVYDFIHNQGDRMIFIYGENDPWSSTSVNPDFRTDAIKLVLPGGSHTARLSSFSQEKQAFIIEKIKYWLSHE